MPKAGPGFRRGDEKRGVITGLDPVIGRLSHMGHVILETALPARPFWKDKQLWQMTPEEWESLCDGCARCCLVKLEDEDSGEIHFTSAACKLLDQGQCRCTDYDNRTARVPDCVQLTPDNVGELNWLPRTCAYRLLSEGKSLPWWHPLVSGRRETVIEAGISVAGRTRSEELFSEDELWTLRWRLPRARRKP